MSLLRSELDAVSVFLSIAAFSIGIVTGLRMKTEILSVFHNASHKKPKKTSGAAARTKPTRASARNANWDFRIMSKFPFVIKWSNGREETVSASRLKELMAGNVWENFIPGKPDIFSRNSAAVLNASVDHQKIKTAEIEIPVIAADVLTYAPGELGDSFPGETRLYYAPEALKDPEYLQTVLRSPFQVQTHEKNTNEGNRGVDGWPFDVRWDDSQKRVIARGVVHGENNVAYAEENRNKPGFGTSAFISFLEVDRTPGVTPDGKSYDAVVRKAVNNHIAILPNVRDRNNVILAMNAVNSPAGDEPGAENWSDADHRRAIADFEEADREWSIELEKVFGRKAGDMRYKEDGKGSPGSNLRRLYEAQKKARDRWTQMRRDEGRNSEITTKPKQEVRNVDYEEFKGHMNAWQAESKKDEELFNRVKNAVMEELKGKNETPAAGEETPGPKNEDPEKKKEDESGASNAFPSDSMIKDFSDALGITFKKTPTLKELAGVAGVSAENDAGLIAALNAKRAELKKPAVEAANAKPTESPAGTVEDFLKTI